MISFGEISSSEHDLDPFVKSIAPTTIPNINDVVYHEETDQRSAIEDIKEYKNYRNMCRICLRTSKNLQNLFTSYIKVDNVAVVDFLRKITDLQFINSNNLPTNICQGCLQDVCKILEFVERCITSDNRINERMIMGNIDTKDLEQEDEIIILKCELPIDRYMENQEKKDYKCPNCPLSFNKKTILNTHLRSHVPDRDKKFGCKECGKQFLYENLLKQHEFKHKNIKPFPCSKCDKGCLTAESLRRHMRLHDKSYVKRIHTCHICNKSFAYPSFLETHLKIHTGEKPHVCNICNKSFSQTSALYFHQRIHSGYKPFTCDICKETFMSKSSLKIHTRKHTNERPYICDICGTCFKQASGLRDHKKTHTGEKGVLCTVCGKILSTTGQLTIHVRSHTGEKPFSCTNCNKSFAAKNMLSIHQRVHTKERPYKCSVCQKCFTQNSTLRAHLEIHKRKLIKKDNKKKVEADNG